MRNKIYNRTMLRKHFATNIFVSNDGKYAERDIISKDTGKCKNLVYDIHTEDTGRAFIYDRYNGGILYLDKMVLTCFRGLPPNDGKQYYPHHKDGKMSNSCIANLEWREETPDVIAKYEKLKIAAWYKKRKIKAYSSGIIKQGSQVLSFVDYLYDRDTDWMHHYPKPWVYYTEKNRWGRYDTHKIDVDKVFEDFGLVNGDKTKFVNPVILHLNNDYLDYQSGNLVWCDASDPLYKNFSKIRHDAYMKKDHDCNYRLSESGWNLIYRGLEPYQDWTDRPEKKLYKY